MGPCRTFGLNTKMGENQEQGAVRRETSYRLLGQISSLREGIGGFGDQQSLRQNRKDVVIGCGEGGWERAEATPRSPGGELGGW